MILLRMAQILTALLTYVRLAGPQSATKTQERTLIPRIIETASSVRLVSRRRHKLYKKTTSEARAREDYRVGRVGLVMAAERKGVSLV